MILVLGWTDLLCRCWDQTDLHVVLVASVVGLGTPVLLVLVLRLACDLTCGAGVGIILACGNDVVMELTCGVGGQRCAGLLGGWCRGGTDL